MSFGNDQEEWLIVTIPRDDKGPQKTGDPPGFVWAIICILFILDLSFPINQYLQQAGIGPWGKYIYGEVAFCVLFLVSKQLLAWLNFGSTVALNSEA
eukprot:scaffold355660_cov55-Attheya_sp.AAC.2